MRKSWIQLKGLSMPCKCANFKFINGFYVPCGKCHQCQKRMAQDWAFRIGAEIRDQWVYNVLLTYDDAHLRYDNKGMPCVSKVDIQLFLKRFRWYLDKIYGLKVRYFLCAEYGGNFHRPHYHMMLFTQKNMHEHEDVFLFLYDLINICWNKGFANLEMVDNPKQYAYYMTAYLLTTSDGRKYDKTNKPFKLMSRQPAIGRCWIEDNPGIVAKCVRDMQYTYSENGYVKSLPRYIRNKIAPEEHLIKFADDYFEHCKEFTNYVITIENYEERRKEVQTLLKWIERQDYERTKVHKRLSIRDGCNRNASQIFARNTTPTLKGGSER